LEYSNTPSSLWPCEIVYLKIYSHGRWNISNAQVCQHTLVEQGYSEYTLPGSHAPAWKLSYGMHSHAGAWEREVQFYIKKRKLLLAFNEGC